METYSLAERPDLVSAFWSIEGDWPQFMLHDPISDRAYESAVAGFPELHLVVMDGESAVARLHAAPFVGSVEALPPRGWDHVLRRPSACSPRGRRSIWARSASSRRGSRGSGLSGPLLQEARRRYRALGCRDLVAPVRPTRKSLEPRTDAAEYGHRVREDGLPADPWLRVHARLGGRVVGVAPLSMVIPGTLAQWREWTGLPFGADGPVEVEGGLSPVHVDVANGHAVYVEPNVWVHHDLR